MPKKNPEHISPAKLSAIWKQISPADWMSLLNEYRPNNAWLLTGNLVKGLCIYHPDSSPSMQINLDRGSVYCFSNSCHHREWDPVRFVAKLSGEEYATALRKLKTRFGIKLPSAFVDNLQQLEEHNEMKLVLLRALNAELVDGFANHNKPEYSYANNAGFFTWIQQRGFPEDTAHLWPVGLLPPRDRLHARLQQNKADEKYLEPALKYIEKYQASPTNPMIYEGSLVLFYFLSPTQVGRPRIRKPNTKDFYAVEDPYNEKVGYFGLNCFPHLAEEKQRPLYAVEGEMDVLSILTHEFSTGNDDVCVVGTGGSMDTDLDSLLSFGFDEIYAIGDNDPAGVDWVLERVSKNTHVSRVFRWNDNDDVQQVKDMDEAVRKFGFVTMYDRLTNPDSFPRVHEWVIDQLDGELQKIKPEDTHEKIEKAAKFGAKLRSEIDRQKFIEYACSVHSLPRESLMQNMIPDDDTMDTFILRLERRLDKEYKFLTERTHNAGTSITAWSVRKKVLRPFAMNSIQAFQAALEADLGRLDEYIKVELGMPNFLNFRLDSKGNPHEIPSDIRLKQITTCFRQAVTGVVKKLAPRESLVELGQGLHYLEDFEERGRKAVVLVNGSKFFQGIINGKGIAWTQLDCPITNRYMFKLKNQSWSNNITTLKDIDDGARFDPKDLFRKIRDVIRVGWRFTHHDLETTYLAANILYGGMMDVFQQVVLTDINGDTHSGKTTLMRCIAGGIPDIRLTDSAITMQDYTVAAIRQTMDGCRLHLYLDEFEDTDVGGNMRLDRRSSSVREIQELFRNLRPGSVAVRGTLSGGPLEYSLCFPVTVCGIHTMRETRDLNRYIHLKLKVMDGLRDPVDPIRDAFAPNELERIRRATTLCFLPRIPEILETYEALKTEFSDNKMLPSGNITRFKQNLLPLATILKLAGEDYVTFMTDFSTLKMEEVRQEGGATKQHEDIWSQVIHGTVNLTRQGGDWGGVSSLAKLLSDPSRRSMLQMVDDLGVYFLEDKRWLIVFWQKAITGILRYSPTYRGMQFPGRLKVIADTDPRVIAQAKLQHSGFLKREVWPRVGTQVSLDEISVIDLTATLFSGASEEAEESADAKLRMLEDIPGFVDPKARHGDFEV